MAKKTVAPADPAQLSTVVADILAVCWHRMTMSELTSILSQLGARTPGGDRWTSDQLREAAALLVRGGVVLSEDLQIVPEKANARCERLVAEGRFWEVADRCQHVICQGPRASGGAGPAIREVRLDWYRLREGRRPGHLPARRVQQKPYRYSWPVRPAPPPVDAPAEVTGADLAATWDRLALDEGARPLLTLAADASGPAVAALADQLAAHPPLLDRLVREVYGSEPFEHPAARAALRERAVAWVQQPAATEQARLALADDLVWCGRGEEATSIVRGIKGDLAQGLRGAALLVQGQLAAAAELLQRGAGARVKKDTASSSLPPAGQAQRWKHLGVLALTAGGGAGQTAARALVSGYQSGEGDLAAALDALLTGKRPGWSSGPWVAKAREGQGGATVSDTEAWTSGWARRCVRSDLPANLRSALEVHLAAARAAQHAWLERELAALLAGEGTWVDAVAPVAPWRIKLDAIARLQRAPAPAEEVRLAWFLQCSAGRIVEITPREQRRQGKGWGVGRPVALKRLADLTEMPWLSSVDRRVASFVEHHRYQSGRYWEESWTLDEERALPALVGHPYLFRSGEPPTPVQLTRGEPVLRVEERGRDVVLRLDPPEASSAVRDLGDTLELMVATDVHRAIAEVLKGEPLVVPRSARKELEEVLGALPAVRVEGLQGVAQEVAADAALWAVLTLFDDGLGVRWTVQPLGEGGPTFPPGGGAAAVAAGAGADARRTTRDLAAELASLEATVARLPSFEEGQRSGVSWRFEGRPAALAAVRDLMSAGVRLQWPPRVAPWQIEQLGPERLRLQLGEDADGVAARGEVMTLGAPLSVESLLGLLTPSPFVELSPGRFAELTATFREQLDLLQRLGRWSRGSLRLSRLAVGVVADLSEAGAQVTADRALTALLSRRSSAEVMEVPVPRGLGVELRPYQVEGFTWLVRAAEAGLGVCLADEMGLGKTVQTLALLLHRAAGGPALVVAPTSVCGVWEEQAARFAPGLRVRRYGPGDRADALRVGPGDVVVCSYGLLQGDADLVCGVGWHTAVLDEAQQIKNSSTARFKATIRLKASARVICTGTPVENHLGDLWSLMTFLNPGLLGTEAVFRERFQLPIERDRSPLARAALRRLMRPFLLRRTKAVVAADLPARTDVLLRVEPNPEEAALYEALRRQALDELRGQASPGWRLRVLAGITRLRQAACNSRLVVDEALPSAKLAAFADLIDALREGGHRALVFSQFVQHLALVDELLEARGITRRYLDGSMSADERAEAVAAFQAGEGDVFLISLRAGGTGLNLTAADQVIHLDPWWNPAVEDQATDRAHRLGQLKPVTVHRLVMRGTVEERILDLHHAKRGLAEDLLAGTDRSLTDEELLGLLGGG